MINIFFSSLLFESIIFHGNLTLLTLKDFESACTELSLFTIIFIYICIFFYYYYYYLFIFIYIVILGLKLEVGFGPKEKQKNHRDSLFSIHDASIEVQLLDTFLKLNIFSCLRR